MRKKRVVEEIIIMITGVWISDKLRLLLPILSLLTLLMLIDYLSGMLAAKKEAFDHPYSKKYGWNSKRGVLGIYKKVGYILTIFVGLSIDFIIYKFTEEIELPYHSKTIFGLLVTLWFTLNEIISILENVGRMGVTLPQFLQKVLSELKKDIENNIK